MPYLDLPDCKLFYKLDDHTDPWTKPETVLFVHGFTENTEAWHAWVFSVKPCTNSTVSGFVHGSV